MIGPPYSGKGTQCKIISEKTKLKHVSTGEVIRREKENGTVYGNKVKEYEENGNYVPDSLIEELLIKIVNENKKQQGIILDGFPRTKEQVDFFLKHLKNQNLQIEKMFILNVSEEELIIRGQKRKQDSLRVDDNDDVQMKRINLYNSLTIPAVEYLALLVPNVRINANKNIDEINLILMGHIDC